MRNLTVGLIIFMAGWGLSRLAYNDPDKDPIEQARPQTSILPDAVITPQTLTDANSGDIFQMGSIENLLQRNDFEATVERYESLQLQSSNEEAVEAREKILNHARQLIEQSRFIQAESLLQRFLVAAFRDVEARLLLAEVYLAQQDFNASIDQLYQVRAYAYRPLMLQRISSRIQSTVARQVASLKGRNDYSTLLALYEGLTQLEPDHAPWFIGLATTQLALDDKQAARSSLLLVAQDPDVGTQAQLMLSELAMATTGVLNTAPQNSVNEVGGIPLKRKGHHFIVDASAAGDRNIRLLIDTGATLTMLSPDVFQQADIQYKNTGRSGVFNTANGPVRAPVYILDSLTIGGWQVEQLEVGVLSLQGAPGIDGLLGMNFLRHFQFFIDQNEELLRLSDN